MNKTAITLLVLAGITVIVLGILFLLGRKRIKKTESTDKKLERLIGEEKYAAAKCMILSDVIYHDRVALGKEQKMHLEYLDGLVERCDRMMAEKKIDERASLGEYLLEIIPSIEYVDLTFVLKYCKPDINFQNKDGICPLMHACINGRVDIAKHLIKERADINARDHDGKTALHHSCISGNYSLVKHLLDSGADISRKDNSGKNIIQHVNPDVEDFVKIVALLVESGAGNID
ncbi:MAG: ankyrin repeat domain-containing protein [Spirochaetes bacterium]|nr:ankyrin repeat domain-containing protein [Spirochaetota bacterium]